MTRMNWKLAEEFAQGSTEVHGADLGDGLTVFRVRSTNWDDTYVVYKWSDFHGRNVPVVDKCSRASLASAKKLADAHRPA